MLLSNTKMEKHEIDLDNFIKERIGGLYPQKFDIEPSPDFSRRVTRAILRLEKRRCFSILYGGAAVFALGPLALRQFWLWVRNDYFSASNFPLGYFVVPAYHFLISSYGMLFLLVIGALVSLRFVFKFRRGEYGAVIRAT